MFDRSREELSSIVKMLKKLLDVFSTILFVVFTLFYIYQIGAHISDSIIRVVIYSLLLILHTLLYFLPKSKSKLVEGTRAEIYESKRKIRFKKKTLKIIKLSVNGLAILWNFIDIILGNATDLRIMIVVLTAIMLFAQVLLEVILTLLITYFDNLRIAIIEDIKDINFDGNMVTKFLSKKLGIQKVLDKVHDENYYSESEKKIALRQKEKRAKKDKDIEEEESRRS